ncbi:hypothetical protein A1OO_08790 [Enterovibrio norvegicus FF-33]|uniref:hypothetical protein n=1 Tax=Enterovibrio norvegicus TaxID=188144 RepID=UPI0002EF29F4|nr:hypothetical protein [Enterovibrio norvegicus]OEE65895.1 hypothetical protein A1OO_08790 [Enterovibrio norvegicus FF-33]
MYTPSDNYLNNAEAKESRRLSKQDAREEALNTFMQEGKEHLLRSREFAGLKFRDFATYFFADFHEGKSADRLVLVLCHLESNKGLDSVRNLLTYEEIMDQAMSAFLQRNINIITSAFDAEQHQAA